MKLSLLSLMMIFSLSSFAGSNAQSNLETEQDVNLKKYMGLWYEYARYENSFQKECLGTIAEYKLKHTPVTRRTYVQVKNTCETKDGELQVGKAKGFVVNKETNATLKVSFVPFLNWFGLFAGDYNILKVGPDYDYALVGDKKRTTFWILSRTKEMPEALYQELLDVAEDRGFRKELIKKSPVFTR
jgi:apolipoprotein D and lipocalin family protein